MRISNEYDRRDLSTSNRNKSNNCLDHVFYLPQPATHSTKTNKQKLVRAIRSIVITTKFTRPQLTRS